MSDNPQSLRDFASDLRKQDNFTEALIPYEALWVQHRAECNEWDGWGYAQCLRKVGRVEDALKVCQDVYRSKSDFEVNNSLYGWCIYDLEIKKSDEIIKKDESKFYKAVNAILSLTKPDKFTPATKTIFRAIKYLKNNRQIYPAQQILQYLEKLTPEGLSTEAGKGVDSEGEELEFSSDLERWYSEKDKALFNLSRYEECIAVCDEALQALSKFHTDNDIWFRYRKGLSLGELGQMQEAVELLKSLLTRKKDWFISRDIAIFLVKMGEMEQALTFATQAALAPGPKELKFRWELFFYLGKILKVRGDTEKAHEHILLATKLRTENEWKIPGDLHAMIEELHLDMGDVRTSQQINNSLVPFWKSLAHANQVQMTGKVKNLVGEGRSGFIFGDDSKEYYFKINAVNSRKRSAMIAGARVKFYVQPSGEAGRKDTATDIEIE